MNTAPSSELLIAGEWRSALGGEVFTATSPATGEDLGKVANGDREDARAAVEAADRAFPEWSRKTAFARAAILHRIGDRIEARREPLTRLLALDQGRPAHTEGYAEVDEVVAMFHMAAEDAVRAEGAVPPSQDPAKRVMLVRRPLGPVAVIAPWNWPYLMSVELLAPALATGNTVVWTPASSTSYCCAELARVIADADLPPGVFNFVTGPGSVVGDEIAGHPKVAMVMFIGSTETGAQVAKRAAGKPQLLELGNNGPMVVMEGADLPRAIEATMVGCFLGAGQSCAAAERLLIHEPIREQFVDMLRTAIGEIRLGDPLAEETTMGPVNNDEVAEKMQRHVADAIDRGAKLVAGGERGHGYPTSLYWQPTLLDGVSRQSETAIEETFGPIAPVMPVESLDNAIATTNMLGYGLVAAIFTPDVLEGLRYAGEVRAGTVNINETSNYFEIHLPFGGGGGTSSGIGRTGGRHIVDELTVLQTITITS